MGLDLKMLFIGYFFLITNSWAYTNPPHSLPSCKQINQSFQHSKKQVHYSKNYIKKTSPSFKPKLEPKVQASAPLTTPNNTDNINLTEIKPVPALEQLPPQAGEVLPTPVLTQEQLTELFFDPNRKVTFELTWNANTKLDRSVAVKQGSDQSVLFQTMATKKLFALMFADLYLMNRESLEQAAEKNTTPNQKWMVQIYFQRFENDLNQFGSYAFNIYEKECLDWLHRGAPKNAESENGLMNLAMICAPGVQVMLALQEDGNIVWRKEIKALESLPYGPGTGRPVLAVQDILKGMNAR